MVFIMKTQTIQESFEKALAPFNPVKGTLRKWSIETTAGPLELEIVEGPNIRSSALFIACVFRDVEKAKAHIELLSSSRLNTYSGKWNWHIVEFGYFQSKISIEQANIKIQVMIDTFFEKVKSIKV